MGRRHRTLSTRVRILAAILVASAAGMAIAGTVAFTVQHARAVHALDERLLTGISVIEPNDAEADYLSPVPYATVAEYLAAAAVHSLPDDDETVISIVDGTVIDARGVQAERLGTDRAFVQAALTAAVRADGATIATAHTDAGVVRYVAVSVTVAADPSTGVQVRALDLRTPREDLAVAVGTFALTGLGALIVIGVAGWFLIGRLLLSPVRTLAKTADAITLSDLRGRVPTSGDDDVAAVGRTVNDMLDRLEGSVDVQRRLLDDVRHELKTPITIVRGHLEMMNVDDRDDVVSARDIGMSELDRMARLVEDIDLLAAVEDDEYTMGIVDISTLTSRVGGLVAAIPGHHWHVLDRAAVTVRGNPDRLLQAWLALCDNAAKYTPAGAPIELGSTMVGSAVHLWVRDHGPGIPAAARHRIFRRFDRGGGRRDVGGTGLGLAIVDTISRAHGGSCTVTDTPGGGATFVIRIPVTLTSTAAFPAPKRAEDLIAQWEETG